MNRNIVTRALDRALFLSSPETLMKIDRACASLSGAALGVGVAQALVQSAASTDAVKKIMEGGLLVQIKAECIIRQQNSMERQNAN